MALHDFDQCDYYYNLAGMFYDKMLPYEKYIYLNNRGIHIIIVRIIRKL